MKTQYTRHWQRSRYAHDRGASQRGPVSKVVTVIGLVALLSGLIQVPAMATETDRMLAQQLFAEGDYRSAAIEWRRLALQATDEEDRAGYQWAAAYAYLRLHEARLTDQLLDEAEWASTDLDIPSTWIRAQAAQEQRDWTAARYFWSTLVRGDTEPQMAHHARRQLAALHLRAGQLDAAREVLQADHPGHRAALDAIDDYATGRDKRPRIGGLLGMFPGLGYAYAGEYGNAFRSLILNAIFIYGMVDTAQNDHWGAFAVITFFEITWYTGSIYGGIDASHRYNQRRQDDALERIRGDDPMRPDWAHLPLISFRYAF